MVSDCPLLWAHPSGLTPLQRSCVFLLHLGALGFPLRSPISSCSQEKMGISHLEVNVSVFQQTPHLANITQ